MVMRKPQYRLPAGVHGLGPQRCWAHGVDVRFGARERTLVYLTAAIKIRQDPLCQAVPYFPSQPFVGLASQVTAISGVCLRGYDLHSDCQSLAALCHLWRL